MGGRDGNKRINFVVQICRIRLVQGFTEPISVSSSGHVIIANHLFALSNA